MEVLVVALITTLLPITAGVSALWIRSLFNDVKADTTEIKQHLETLNGTVARHERVLSNPSYGD